MSIESDLSKAKLYERVYKPSFDKAESALSSGADPKKYQGNEYNYALAMINKSKQLQALSKKHGKKITITDTGPSENNWRFKMNKQAALEQICKESFINELEKIALSQSLLGRAGKEAAKKIGQRPLPGFTKEFARLGATADIGLLNLKRGRAYPRLLKNKLQGVKSSLERVEHMQSLLK